MAKLMLKSLSFLWIALMMLSCILAACSGPRTIPDGTRMEELDLSGLSYEELDSELEKWQQEKLENTITLIYENKEINYENKEKNENRDINNGIKEFKLAFKELGAKLNKERVLSDINNRPGQVIEAYFLLDKEKATALLDEKLIEFKQKQKNASFEIKDNRFIVIEAVPGKRPDPAQIIREIESRSYRALAEPIPVFLTDIPPDVSTEDMRAMAFDGIIAEFSTNFNPNERNRTANLSKAAQTLDQTIIYPGKEFSFNETVGPRTPETGYKDAYIIEGDQYVLGTGGGICQVSSTLYNAVLLADLPVTERAPHAVAVDYVPLGQDATVYYPEVDLKFLNNSKSLLYIRTKIAADKLTVRLYGQKTGKQVKLVHEIEKEIPGEAGRKGYIVKTWKVVRDHQGNTVETFISRDTYAPPAKIKDRSNIGQ